MRIESTNARTWLAAAVAGWALVVWGLALAGLGGRIAAADDDGAAAAAVSAALPAPDAQPPLADYGDVAARPLFAADRRPHPFFIDPSDEGEGASSGFDYVLTSVLRTPDFAMAILQPAGGGESIRLRVGDAPPDASNWLLESVDARSVVFTGPEGPRTLELRVYDGVGGQAPTPLRPPAAPTEAAQTGTTARNRAPAPGNGPQPANAPPANAARTPPTRAGSAAAATAPAASPASPAVDPAQPAAAPATETGTPPEAQVEAIRRRIEERRARLQQENATGGRATP